MLGSLPPMWEMMLFLDPTFSLMQPWLLWPFGE